MIHKTACLWLWLLALLPGASAWADEGLLTITGTFASGSGGSAHACDLAVDKTTVDLGILPFSESVEHGTLLRDVPVTIAVFCNDVFPTQISVTDPGPPGVSVGRDEEGGLDQASNDPTREFGIGVDAAGQPLGAMLVQLGSAVMLNYDGTVHSSIYPDAGQGVYGSTTFGYATSRTGPWTRPEPGSKESYLQRSGQYWSAFPVANPGSSGYLPYFRVTLRLTVLSHPLGQLDLSSAVNIDGSLQITLLY